MCHLFKPTGIVESGTAETPWLYHCLKLGSATELMQWSDSIGYLGLDPKVKGTFSIGFSGTWIRPLVIVVLTYLLG